MSSLQRNRRAEDEGGPGPGGVRPGGGRVGSSGPPGAQAGAASVTVILALVVDILSLTLAHLLVERRKTHLFLKFFEEKSVIFVLTSILPPFQRLWYFGRKRQGCARHMSWTSALLSPCAHSEHENSPQDVKTFHVDFAVPWRRIRFPKYLDVFDVISEDGCPGRPPPLRLVALPSSL